MSLNHYCPGDRISYHCSIESGYEDLYLTWLITIRDNSPINITYTINSPLRVNISIGPSNTVTSTLTNYSRFNYANSALTFNLTGGIDWDETMIECATEGESSSLVLAYQATGRPQINLCYT